MNMYSIIEKKKRGQSLHWDEIAYFIKGVTDGSIPDYQTSALLMAICLKGLDEREIFALTAEMAGSGEIVSLRDLPGVKTDKHSTGGVGDKTTLICAPLAAACGVTVAKMSGRGLGHTGGTVDKLESIPGFKTDLSRAEFTAAVRKNGIAVAGQSGELAPADKKLYALRDVTATVDSLGLIASSIMSKKLASGADAILLDVKTGAGAFMKDVKSALALAAEMIKIGLISGKNTAAVITDMDTPLGRNIGNALEVREAMEVLAGGGPEDLKSTCIELAGGMIWLAGLAESEDMGCEMAQKALSSGAGMEKFRAMVSAQGGDLAAFEALPKAAKTGVIPAGQDGFIAAMNAEAVGLAACAAGAGREKKEDEIDPLAGIILRKKPGEAVKKGETVAEIYASNDEKLARAQEIFAAAVKYSAAPPALRPHILARGSIKGVTWFIEAEDAGIQ